MVGRKRATRSSASRGAAGAARTGGDIYLDMLNEAGVNASPRQQQQQESPPERPLKRRRAGTRKREATPDETPIDKPEASGPKAATGQPTLHNDEEDAEFEDVLLPKPTVQTMELESDDEDEENAMFEDVDFAAWLAGGSAQEPKDKELELNLTEQKASTAEAKKVAERRKPLSKEDRERRAETHKAHLLCLLSHVARRNHWCNDGRVQESLRPYLTDKMLMYLNPGTHLSQFGRTESLKNGLKQVEAVWKVKFDVTERGLRRALWAEDPEQLQDVRHIHLLESLG